MDACMHASQVCDVRPTACLRWMHARAHLPGLPARGLACLAACPPCLTTLPFRRATPCPSPACRYVGTDGVYTLTTPYERDEKCPICSAGVGFEVAPSSTLQQVGGGVGHAGHAASGWTGGHLLSAVMRCPHAAHAAHLANLPHVLLPPCSSSMAW